MTRRVNGLEVKLVCMVSWEGSTWFCLSSEGLLGIFFVVIYFFIANPNERLSFDVNANSYQISPIKYYKITYLQVFPCLCLHKFVYHLISTLQNHTSGLAICVPLCVIIAIIFGQ